MPLYKEKNLCGDLNVPDKYELGAVVLVGYPDHNPSAPKRVEIEKIMHYQRYKAPEVDFPSNTILSNWSSKQVQNYQERISRRGFSLEYLKQYDIDEVLKEVIQRLENKSVIDIDSFSGYFLSKLQKNKNIKAYGHYKSDKILESGLLYNKELENKNIIISEDIPETKEKFDILTLFFKLEHFPDPKKSLQKMNKLLKHDGEIIIATKNKYSFLGFMDFIHRTILRRNGLDQSYYGCLTHLGPWKFYSKRKVKKLLKESGFKEIKVRGKFLLPLSEIGQSALLKKKLGKTQDMIFTIMKIAEKIIDKLYISYFFGKTLIIRGKKVEG